MSDADAVEIFDTLVDSLSKRIHANRDLAKSFEKKFGLETDSIGEIAFHVGRFNTKELCDWMKDLSEEDFRQIYNYVYRSILAFAEDLDEAKPLNAALAIYYKQCCLYEVCAIRGLMTHSLDGLDDMKNIINSSWDYLKEEWRYEFRNVGR